MEKLLKGQRLSLKNAAAMSATQKSAGGYSNNQTNQTNEGVVQCISHRHCTIIQRSGGYNHYLKEAAIPTTTDLIKFSRGILADF